MQTRTSGVAFRTAACGGNKPRFATARMRPVTCWSSRSRSEATRRSRFGLSSASSATRSLAQLSSSMTTVDDVSAFGPDHSRWEDRGHAGLRLLSRSRALRAPPLAAASPRSPHDANPDSGSDSAGSLEPRSSSVQNAVFATPVGSVLSDFEKTRGVASPMCRRCRGDRIVCCKVSKRRREVHLCSPMSD